MAFLDPNGVSHFWEKIKNNFVKKVDGKGLSTNDYTNEDMTKLAGIAEGATKTVVTDGLSSTSTTNALSAKQGKVLDEKISAVSASIPKTVASLSDAGNYALKTDLATVYKWKGSVAKESDLPKSGMAVGDTYDIQSDSTYGSAGTNVAWTGSAWDSLGTTFKVETITNAELDEICV